MYCNKCGTYLPDDAAFCPNCGTRVQRPAEAVVVQPASHGRNHVVLIAVTAVIVALLVSILYLAVIMPRTQQALTEAEQASTAQTSTAQSTEAAEEDEQSGAEEATETESDEAEESEESAETATTVNNYYYYVSTAAPDDDYYTSSLSSGYLWPTDSQYITATDLRGLSQDTVAAIRNEIYARHGYAFTTSRWQTYFASKTWYERDSTCTDDTIKARLSSIELANISTIVAYEEAQGWRD